MTSAVQGLFSERGLGRWLVMSALALLCACATPSKDLVTASDESDGAKRGRIRLELAMAYFQRAQYPTALDEVKQAIVADPGLGAAYNLRGLIYGAMSEDRLAEESYQKALQINANDASAMHNYGWFLCQRGRYNEAQDRFTRVLAVPGYPDTVQTTLTQGVCYARAGQLALAEKSLLDAYEAAPGNPMIASNLGDVLYRRGEYERARFYVRRVNNVHDVANAETLWLALRIERKMGNRSGVSDLSQQLSTRFPRSREAALLDRGAFDD